MDIQKYISTEMLAYIGSVASIVALLLTAIGGVALLFKRILNSREEQLKRLEESKRLATELASNATTQGERQDLFIYNQNLLSGMRHEALVLEIMAAMIHVISFVMFIFIGGIQSDTIYLADEIFGSTPIDSKQYLIILTLVIVLLTTLNIIIRLTLGQDRERLKAIADGYLEATESTIKQRFKIEKVGYQK